MPEYARSQGKIRRGRKIIDIEIQLYPVHDQNLKLAVNRTFTATPFAVKINPAKCALLTTVFFYIAVSLVYLPRPTLACYYGKYNESVPFEL